MRSATLISARDVHGSRWTLWSLSVPLPGQTLDTDGRVRPRNVSFVLTVEGFSREHGGTTCRVLESNAKGELVAWGAWPASRGDDAADSLKRLGYFADEKVVA